MAADKSLKKITKITPTEDSSVAGTPETTYFTPGKESYEKAKKYRLISIAAWVAAIGFEIWAIFLLRKAPVNVTFLIVLIIFDLAAAVTGSLFWKKANQLDPASESNKIKFFIQNQLGLIVSVIAFLPLVIIIFTNKNLSKKQKGLVGSIAAIAFVIAGYFGIDFNPPSQEQYNDKANKVEAQKGDSQNTSTDKVYWTKSGKSYHLYQDCSYINSQKTNEIFEGTSAQALELKNISDICDRCEKKSFKEAEEAKLIP